MPILFNQNTILSIKSKPVSVAPPPPVYVPSLDFSNTTDPKNSMYLALF